MDDIDRQARAAVDLIVEDICLRTGLGTMWEEIPPDRQEAIRVHWTSILRMTILPDIPTPTPRTEPCEELIDVWESIMEGTIIPSECVAVVDLNELYITGNGVRLFEGVVGPEEVAQLLGIEDVHGA